MARILIVADEGRELGRRVEILKKDNYEVCSASTREGALQWVREATIPFDLVLVAMRLDLDPTVGLVREMSGEHQGGKLLMMSHMRQDEGTVQEFIAAGADDFGIWPDYVEMPRFVKRYLK